MSIKAKCKKCRAEFPWSARSPEFCAKHRRELAKPIDTVCAACGKATHGLYCSECSAALTAGGRKLLAQEQWNRLSPTERDKRKLTNPRYSEGQFSLEWPKETP